MINYRNIEISFGNKLILKNTGIDLKAGCVTLIHGPSGTGKTSLFYRLALVNTDCDILFEGKKIQNRNIDRYRRESVAFVMQSNELIDYLSVEEIIREYAAISGSGISEKRIFRLLDIVNLDVPLNQKCSLLSLGERERLCIACALSKNPQLIILDEPTASLDRQNKSIIFNLLGKIASMGKYVVFSSHEKDAFEYADEIYLLNNHELIQEKSAEELCSVQSSHRFSAKRFLSHHTACYKKKNKLLLFMNGWFHVLTVLLSSSILTWGAHHLHESQQLLYETTLKYLYVTDGANEGYLDRDTKPVNLNIGYPLYKVSVLCGGTIPVIPYYEETDYTDRVDTYLSSNDHGSYISFRAKEMIENNTHIQQFMQFQILSDTGISEKEFEMRGVLKQGVRAYELSDNEVYIAVWYEDYEKLNHHDIIGRICFYNTYEELETARNDLTARGFTVNDKSSSFDRILDVTQKEQQFNNRIQLILFCVSCLLVTGVYIFGIYRRIKEITLLRINGVTASLISRMLMSEQIPAIIIIIVSGIIVSVIMDLIKVVFFPSFMISFIGLYLVQIILQLATIIYLSYYEMDSVFRN